MGKKKGALGLAKYPPHPPPPLWYKFGETDTCLAEHRFCLPLIRYDSTSWGWSDKKKREEMKEDNAW
jgi:hypothetical protein